MKIVILTLFPEMIENALKYSIIGRAIENNLIDIKAINIRDFSKNKHNKVDDYPYGGGSGMVMTAQPIFDAWEFAVSLFENKPKTIYMSPQGKVFNQKIAFELNEYGDLILLCGHYEGIDERIIEEIIDEEISIGDYVLTGGEIPAMALTDAICRLTPGVLSSEQAYLNESHGDGLLEYPQYTRPEVFHEKSVPDVLVSGHHKNIEDWRLNEKIKRTKLKRPDLYKKYLKSKTDLER